MLAEFATALQALRVGRSYSALTAAAKKQPRRGGHQPALPPSTVSDLLNGKSVPSRDTVVTFLTACQVASEAQEPWLAAWERVGTSHLRKPPGAVSVRDARPRRLGVHPSIQVDPQAHDLPVYVRRDFDDALHAAINEAAAGGGMVLLTGSSSVGKTRALFEAVRAVLPEWWLLHPADATAVRVSAEAPAPRTVVWLDELQRYLSQAGGLPVGTVRELLDAGLVVVATLWPDEYGKRTTPPVHGEPDRYDNDRTLLGMARIIDVPDTFTAAERQRAEQLSADGRIRAALDTADAGLTQILAAGPELVRRWEQADVADPRQCYGKAVITAALDARRVGAQAPVTADFLAAAAPAYLSSAQQAGAPSDWFEQALGYATTRLHGATACLTPVAAGMGLTAGWLTADYLHQHARQARRTVPLPETVWHALVAHLHPDDEYAVELAAQRRLQLRHADTITQRRAAAGDAFAAAGLAHRLVEQGRQEQAIELLRGAFPEDTRPAFSHARYAATKLADLLVAAGRHDEAIAALQARVDAGDAGPAIQLADLLVARGRTDDAIALLSAHPELDSGYAALRLAELLAEQGGADQLEARVEAGDTFYAQPRLARLLAMQGRTDRLRTRAEAGDTVCARELAKVLSGQGDTTGAVAVLRGCGDGHSARTVAEELVMRGRTGEAVAILQAEADAHDELAVTALAKLLRADHAVTLLRAHVGCGGGISSAVRDLAALLAERDRPDEAIDILYAHGDQREHWIREDLVRLLERQGRIDEAATVLRAADDRYRLGGLLVMHDRIDEAIEVARALVATGDLDGPRRLAELLAKKGSIDELRMRAEAGDEHAATHLVDLWNQRGAVDELRALADAGDPRAEYLLVDRLAADGRVDEAIARLSGDVDAGYAAPVALAELLLTQGRVDDALRVVRAHPDSVGVRGTVRLAKLIAKHDRVDDAITLLRACLDDVTLSAAVVLGDLLVAHGRVGELRTLADAGTPGAADRLVNLLAAEGRTAELYDEVHAGTPGAAGRLIILLASHGENPRAEQLATFGL
jgi:predicted negative regulator of RcsB-dependent stress response